MRGEIEGLALPSRTNKHSSKLTRHSQQSHSSSCRHSLAKTQQRPTLLNRRVQKESSMPEEKALVPVEEQTVDFYGDAITAALVEVDGNTSMYVPIKPISDYLGLAWSGQFERIQ